ncbi:hypothetical protein [Microcella alkalica]|uniref:hypothetical protein n=1 Tax=Microcella alkalica TaxID=355930 RepID=UPI00145E9F82|nr:hypothetical protein [Microcella alkalica]
MAIKKSLSFEIFGKDKSASKTMRGVGKEADSLGKRMASVGKAMAAGLAVAGAAAVAFGVESVKAFAEAQESQNRLRFALEKFPKAADTNIKALGRLNEALMKKTRFDDDAIASAQSVLLQYELTGQQLEDLTPLLLDFAARTGQDLTSASEQLGKALLGQGRALKDVGIDFVDTGSVAGNFDQIMAGLRKQVGGFAEEDAKTAAGTLEQLRNRFGEIQEKIGEALMPKLMDFAEWLEGDGAKAVEGLTDWIVDEAIPNLSDFVDWVVKWKDELALVTGAIGAATAAQWLLNGAMAANPVGIVVAALIAASAWIVHVFRNFEKFRLGVIDAAAQVGGALVGIARGVNGFIQNMINNMIAGINTVIRAVNGLLSAVGLPRIGTIGRFTMDQSGLDRIARNFQQNRSSGAFSGSGGTRPRYMAEGGIVLPTPGGTNAVIGEAGSAEAVIPLSQSALARYGLGGDGLTVNVTVSGVSTRTQGEMGREIVKAIQAAQDVGLIRKGLVL